MTPNDLRPALGIGIAVLIGGVIWLAVWVVFS